MENWNYGALKDFGMRKLSLSKSRTGINSYNRRNYVRSKTKLDRMGLYGWMDIPTFHYSNLPTFQYLYTFGP